MAARTLNSQGADFSLLAAAEGNLARLFSLDVIGAHVRLLLAIAALGPLPRALISSPLQPGELGSTLLAFGGIALLSLAALFTGLLLTRVMP